MSRLLEYDMIEVIDEDETAKNEEENEIAKNEGEDEKQREEEEQKEEKMLYDIHHVYRTVEKRLIKKPQNYVANSFGFKDKIGDGASTFLHLFFDPSLDRGTLIIRKDKTDVAIE